ncbi:BTB POZ domain-containing KCTD21, partial [Brachionus plicatilis]
CDHAKKTLTIIKTTGNYIYGGYTEQSWDGNAKINPAYQAYAIYCNSSYGPTFGNGHDIHISNYSNSHIQYSSIPQSYGSQNTYLSGSQQFTVSQIEAKSTIFNV